jgi:hypothetical protein
MSEQANERFEQVGEFDQYLTHLDLELHPRWKEVLLNGDRDAFETILKDFGADLSYGYEEEVAKARARRKDLSPSQQVVTGVLVRFKERTDKWWVDNMMDVSDIIRNTKDSIRATGMRLASNEDSPMYQAMIAAASQQVVNVEIAVDMGEENIQKEEVQ